MKEKITFLESVNEAKTFLNYCKKKELTLSEFKIIALQLDVQIFLKKNNILYENTLKFFSNESQKRIMLQSEKWMIFLKDNISITNGDKIKDSYNNTFCFHMRFYINYLLMYIEIIYNTYEKYGIDEIYVCTYQNPIKHSSSTFLNDNENCIGEIAKLFSKGKNISFYSIPIEEKIYEQNEDTLSSIDKIINAIFKFIIINYINNKKIVISSSLGYNLDKFIKQIKYNVPQLKWVVICDSINTKRKIYFLLKQLLKIIHADIKDNYVFAVFPIDLFNNKEISQSIKDDLEKIINNFQTGWKSIFIYKDICISFILSDIIKKHLQYHILQFYQKSKSIEKIIELSNIQLTTGIASRDMDMFIGELSHKNNIPTLMISHGTIKSPENDIERIEYYHMGKSLILSDYYTTASIQTPTEEKHAKYYNCNHQFIKSGPLIFSTVDKKKRKIIRKKFLLNDKDILILYAPSMKLRTNLRFYVTETIDEVMSTIKDLVSAVNNIENAYLLIRYHPILKIPESELRLLLPKSNKIFFHYNKPFYEALSASDLLVNFGSTTIDDSLQNFIPVLLYNKWNRYIHYHGENLKPNNNHRVNGVYYINNKSYLEYALKWIINNHILKNVSPSVFDNYVYSKNYFNNMIKYFNNIINNK